MIYCKHSTHLLNTLKNQCKTIKQIHQTHAQIITKGLFSPNLLITLLTTFNNIITPECRQSHPYPRTDEPNHYPLSIFNLITNPSPFSYNTIIRTHTLLNLPENALLFFAKMRRNGVSPDTHTFPFVLKAIAMMKNESLCKMVHTHLIKFGFLICDVFVCNNLVHVYCVCGCVWDGCKVFDESCVRDVVTYNVVIDGLVKCGEIEHGRRVFDEMGISVRDATTWGTMMAGYVQVKRFDDCLEIYDQMVELKVKPDNIALVAVLGACGRVGKLEKGKEVHEYIKRSKIRIDSFLCTALVDFYAKCGCIETAMGIFEYDHAGLIGEARGLFDEMESVYEVPKELKHYGCMADLLGRAGLIKEAIDMIENMPMSGDVFVWGSLLGGCRLHGNVEVAEKAAEHIMEISPEDGGVYSTMADIYANAKRWDDLTKIRSLRDSRRVNKNAGCSLIQLDGATHEFVAGDDLHPQTDEIYLVLNSIGQHQCELQL
ncbi:pentatricopeptide repeat (PPR) superfamily protein [Artemisia annua]|uniref:Pentatricopeptide repeat (PPR) superfamily protein n=1 Tax=Artemisia annua TaxID=35608 RepID=A0A2U1NJM4_ARTAN|nr:pentatricopeptide repeat (PPR) superfamily protein [Artemisia annua]